MVSGPGLGTVSVPAVFTVLANNDNVPDPAKLDNNIFVPIKRFDHLGYIDIEFTVFNSGGTTEYQVFESVDNNTGIDWARYKMQLGFGTGAGFTLSTPLDGLDFDAPDYDLFPSSSAMPLIDNSDEDILVFSGGTHSSGAESYQFRIDVPDFGDIPGGYTFTLRQMPIAVPEPASVVLLGLALAGLVVRRSRD